MYDLPARNKGYHGVAPFVITAIFPRNDNLAVLPEFYRFNDELAKRADDEMLARCTQPLRAEQFVNGAGEHGGHRAAAS